jgi:threonyl-tRNA synthetase
VQVELIPIADRHIAYAQDVARRLKEVGLRVEVDERGERMNAKIRDAQNMKIPYMLVIGDREAADGVVNVRLRTGEQRGSMPVADFISSALDVVARKALI